MNKPTLDQILQLLADILKEVKEIKQLIKAKEELNISDEIIDFEYILRLLPDKFYTKDAIKIGTIYNVSERTMQRWLRKSNLIIKIFHGLYIKKKSL